MKRARSSGGSVTGGTGDIKPQIFTLNTGIAGAIDDYVVNQVSLPISRFGTVKNKTTVFEMLWVDWYLNINNILDNQTVEFAFLTTSTSRVDGLAATVLTLQADLNEQKNFAFAIIGNNLVTTGAALKTFPIHINLTDSNGNGVLVATDRIIAVGGGVGNQLVGDYIAKIGYRQTNIDITEYVGIVQSQQ